MDLYCMYLRKSRADLDAEARGEGETLKKHRVALFALAKKLNINITEVYQEIVSGDRIVERPEMQRLLQDVEDGRWTGVLVMEVERLARGDTMDQGLVAQAFKYGDTKIITPIKTYDPNNEFDEEYFEFGLFMSRREYKTINRRLQSGRIGSVREGNYLGNIAPYGYDKTRLPDNSYSLVPHPDQAPIVKMIFDMYTNQNMGMGTIANKLNSSGIPTAKNSVWTVATLNGIVRNPIYCGKIAWNRRPEKKTRKSGVITKSRPRVSEEQWIVADGKHEALVSQETWQRAQEILSSRSHAPTPSGVITSSLAGLVRCSECGRLMVRRPYTVNKEPSLICVTPMCKNISSQFALVEERILEGLKLWAQQYKAQWDKHKPDEVTKTEDVVQAKKQILAGLEKRAAELRQQSGNLHDLLERGVYTVEVFLERSQNLAERIAETEAALNNAAADLEIEMKRKQAREDIIPRVEYVLSLYYKTEDAAVRNELLKSVLESAEYTKTVRGHWTRPESMRKFDLKLYPKLPEI